MHGGVPTATPPHMAKCSAVAMWQIVDEAAWKALAADSTFAKFNRFLLRSFIQLTPTLVWCPNPAGCDNVVSYSGTRGDMRCDCGYAFCFRCQLEAHEPASCEE